MATKKASRRSEPSKKAAPKKAAPKKAAPKKAAPKKAAPSAKKGPKPVAGKVLPAPRAFGAAEPVLTQVAEAETALGALPGNFSEPEVSNSGVKVGDMAKAFSLFDQNGAPVSDAALAGRPYVLYFYPKDNTPGCTQEACDFRDDHAAFRQADVEVFGVSPDSVGSHAGFALKHELPFRLISDPDRTLAQAYGVWATKKNYGKEYMGVVRSTFLIGPDGKLAGVWDQVKVKGHVEAVLQAITTELGR